MRRDGAGAPFDLRDHRRPAKVQNLCRTGLRVSFFFSYLFDPSAETLAKDAGGVLYWCCH